MLRKWKAAVITGLFVFGALSFILGLLPLLADIFWILWFTGCGACLLALVLTVTVPARRSAGHTPDAQQREAGRPAGDGPDDGLTQP
ncbi:MAG: hypothetical protein L0H52_08440 [Brevibacterium sp.]|nr:hypothetical protein [Brevibacterium sp.]